MCRLTASSERLPASGGHVGLGQGLLEQTDDGRVHLLEHPEGEQALVQLL